MARNNNREKHRYTCLFCNQTFTADQVLFADEITGSRSVAPDPVQRIFFNRDFIRAPSEVPTQLVHNWGDPSVLERNFDLDPEIPRSIRVRRANGDLPQMNGERKVAFGKSSLTITAAMLADAQDSDPNMSDDEQERKTLRDAAMATFEAGDEKLLIKRICPHCHCTVPVGIGQHQVYRIAMLGGKGCGKTTYMLLAANQMIQRQEANNTLRNELQLADGWLVGESELFYSEIFNLYQQGNLASTSMAEGKSIFPLVIYIEPNEPKKPFFLVLQDFPGEGMLNEVFLINNRSVLRADGAVLLIDPGQLRGAQQFPNMDREQETFCEEPIATTFRSVRTNINAFTKMQKIIVTLHKIDRLYEQVEGIEPRLRRNDNPLLGEGALYLYHANQVSMHTLDMVDQAVCHLFADMLNQNGDAMITHRNMCRMLGCRAGTPPHISFKGISAHTWAEGSQAFESNLKLGSIGNGHRLLEPVLELLADAGLLPSDADVPKRRGFFDFLRGRRTDAN